MKYTNVSLDILVSTRADWAKELDDIDAELERRGVRVTAKPAGRARDVSLLVVVALAKGPLSSRAIAKRTGQTPHACDQMLSKLCLAGELRRKGRGLYALPESP